MIVFKTFWKIINKYKGTIILYTVMLIVFGGLNMVSNDPATTFVDSKPDVLIINKDENKGLTNNLIKYIENNSNIIKIENNEDKVNDALFYRDVNYIIYIPKNYRRDLLEGHNPTIDIKSTGDYQSSLAEMMLTRYIKTQNIYLDELDDEQEIINTINKSLKKKTSVTVTSKIDTNKISSVARYFNFASYSIMAVIIYIVCLVLDSFHKGAVNKRTIISSTNYKEHNRMILFASFIYSIIVWLLYCLLGLVLFGEVLFTIRGLIYFINTFIFTFCSLTLALLISSIIHDKNAINGIVNVLALGSAFLCGAFVPAEWLPDTVLKIAHILPSYWYINSNELLANIEVISMTTLKPIIINTIVIIVFSISFIILNNIVSKKRQIID